VRRLAILLALAGVATAQPLVLTSPADYQVFQRQTRDRGTIRVSGHVAVDRDWVEARIAGGAWSPLTVDPVTHRFQASLPAASGGFFAVEARVLQSGKAVAEITVPHVGIGEVFLIAGQSNATNYGEQRQQTRSKMVVTFSGGDWRIADDPQPGVQDNSTKGSFIPAFGDALYDRLHVPIAVACVGHGSTSIRQWLPKGERYHTQPTMTRFAVAAGPDAWESTGQLFDGLMWRIAQFPDHGFRALLWHQGESDAHQKPDHQISAGEYRALTERLIQASRRQAGWNFPWFAAQASYHTPDDPAAPEVRAAQADLWKSGIALEGPDTDQLTGDNRQNNGKGVHFSAKGLQAHGRLWAEKVAAYVSSQF
jgi:hypothetical protein